MIEDKGVAALYDLLGDTPKIKTLKLMKNGITDDGGCILLKVSLGLKLGSMQE